MRCNDIPEIKLFLERSKHFTTYDIQNEMLELTSNELIREIVKENFEADIYSIIVDETIRHNCR